MLLATLVAAAAYSATPAWDQLYEKAKPSIPIILSVDGAECAGALVEPTLVLTAHHCIATLHALSVVWADAPRAFEEADVV